MNKCKRGCVNNSNNFFYICGRFTLYNLKKPITDQLKHAYKLYFQVKK